MISQPAAAIEGTLLRGTWDIYEKRDKWMWKETHKFLRDTWDRIISWIYGSLFTFVGLCWWLQRSLLMVSFHIHRPLLMTAAIEGTLLRGARMLSSVLSLLMKFISKKIYLVMRQNYRMNSWVSFHIHGSLFTFIGLFSYSWWNSYQKRSILSWDRTIVWIHGSLFTLMGLFSHS